LAERLNPKPVEALEWLSPWSKPRDGYRARRVFGTILMFAALGFAFVGGWRGMLFGLYDRSAVGIAPATPLLAMEGIGFFVASPFVPRPFRRS